MFLLMEHVKLPVDAVMAILGCKDRNTIFNNCSNVRESMKISPALKEEVERVIGLFEKPTQA